ncbi:hypothetical protein [Actinotalea subterranea]|uniref:hypothetical protein n=1 Tax=Actinotalea subterranea TaxID=2607497 RepID=UPI00165DA561|nr:hypothetical protein [Actinotalea subterranea]
MDFDLQRGLRDLGADPAVRGTVLPVDTLLRRAHRRRAVRATTYSAVGTGAAAALVVGGVTLADARPPVHEPAPAAPTRTATATPRPTPTPTPTATPTPPPPPAFQPAWDLCGTDADLEWGRASGEVGLWGWATGEGADGEVLADVGAPVRAEVRLMSLDDSGTVTATVGRSVLRVWNGDDATGSIAAVATSPVTLSVTGTTQPDGLVLGTLDATFAACDSSPTAGGGGAGPVAEDVYVLTVETILSAEDGTTTTTAASGLVVIGDPDDTDDTATPPPPPPAPPAPVTGDPSTLAPVGYGVGSIGVPACGATWFSSVPASTWWSVGGSVAHTGATVEVDVTSTGTGLDIPQGAAFEPLVTITRDGVVVAQTPDEARTPFALVNWTTGSTVTRHASLPAVACTTVAGVAAGAPLPSGTYQVWAIQGVRRDLSASSGVNMMYGGPWTLTVP